MLNRVRKALLKHLSPISSQTASTVSEPQKNNQTEPVSLSLITNPSSHSAQEDQNPHLETTQVSPGQASEEALQTEELPLVADPFLLLLNQLKSERSHLMKWIGKQAYLSLIKNSKAKGKLAQGIILNEKVE